MNRLQSELRRLYLVGSGDDGGGSAGLVGTEGQVRAMVFELARPADWSVLAAVWRGVQRDLELPAPAIAVSGTDGIQLWFSLAEPVPAPLTHAFLEMLRKHYLADTPARRVGLWPAVTGAASAEAQHAAPVPALKDTGNWSAFVAPDLAPVFADTPWLDIEPGDEGQAELLRSLGSIKPADFEAALQRLTPAVPPQAAVIEITAPLSTHAKPGSASGGQDARGFLRQVMNDAAVPLALRIEAAKALLPYENDRGLPGGC